MGKVLNAFENILIPRLHSSTLYIYKTHRVSRRDVDNLDY